MASRFAGAVCVVLVTMLSAVGEVRAQSTGVSGGSGGISSPGTIGANPANLLPLLSSLTPQQQAMLMQLLQSGSFSSADLSALLAQLGTGTGTTPGTGTGTTSPGTGTSGETTTTQPSGPPRNFILYGISEHQAFYKTAFNMTPAERRAAASQPSSITTPRIPLALVVTYLLNLMQGNTPSDGSGTPGTGPTPPAAKSGEGVVAFITADDTSLSTGQTTTARLWVQQSSPNAARDNGIFSVAVNVTAVPAGIVQSQTPVTVLSDWKTPASPLNTGTATTSGGIDKVTVGASITAGNKTLGLDAPVEVFNWSVKGVAAGTVTLSAINLTSGGFQGVLDYQGQMGDEANYVPVQITVK